MASWHHADNMKGNNLNAQHTVCFSLTTSTGWCFKSFGEEYTLSFLATTFVLSSGSTYSQTGPHVAWCCLHKQEHINNFAHIFAQHRLGGGSGYCKVHVLIWIKAFLLYQDTDPCAIISTEVQIHR
jgi:hypothetical protein